MSELSEQEIFTKVVNHSSKNERIAWNRKYKKLSALIEEKITPIEEQVLELIMQKQPYLDEAVAMRDVLVKECVHPREFLLTKDDHILCKFCNNKLNVNV